MVTIDLNSSLLREKVYGCWLGKNGGGTLGAPLEEAWGRPELFDVWWYPKLQEGGIPNDDLEMQLIWLKALEEVGPNLRAADMAQYWLKHIGYNWDEYGLSKTNLRLGLLPPVSGVYNNWFNHCMGSPIRSEIWACVAPGVPAIAARFAYEDAICDHAGGEGVYGSLFNTAVESAAFVVEDREQLLEIGLSYIPPWSETTKAIQAARAAYAAGETWQVARERVLAATPSPVAQYSPINLGFQVIGWLYGDDFGDAICKAVNCGYDTDCTGATLGSYLGILAGQYDLPRKWTEPLGEAIATNESWGGLRHASDGANPVPLDLTDLTERVCAAAKKVLSAHGLLQDGALVQVDPANLLAGPEIRALWEISPYALLYQNGAIEVEVQYGETPACIPGSTRTLQTTLINPTQDEIRVTSALHVPERWQEPTRTRELVLAPTSRQTLDWEITIPAASRVENTNTLWLMVQAHGYPAQPATPIVLIGARKYRYAGPYTGEGQDLFDAVLEPETARESVLAADGRAGTWQVGYALDNVLPVSDQLKDGGALYVQTYLWAPSARAVWMGPATTSPVKFWVNGTQYAAVNGYRPLRPGYANKAEFGFASVPLVEGWNEVLVKFVHAADAGNFEAHLVISSDDEMHDGQPDLGWTRFPWDVE